MWKCSKDITLNSLSSNEIQDELINLGLSIEKKIQCKEVFFSLELSSNMKFEGIHERFSSNAETCFPLFYALPSHHGVLKCNSCDSLKLIASLPNNTLLHLVANNLKKNNVKKLLDEALLCGKMNILALRGDAPFNDGDFAYTIDLVKFIKAEFGSKICICVAGYPQMHPDSISKESDLFYLKEKVKAGASFVITQFFFESSVFVDFVKDCTHVGITVPIIPGIFPFSSFKSLMKMSTMCSVNIPNKMLEDLHPIKEDNAKIRNYGINLAVKLIREIYDTGVTHGFHLYTLNRSEMALEIFKRVGWCQPSSQ
ncbi:methylenetetrahydrofolate reductase [Orussus abietinus]|uniref:methylenetetrahydrofolate reductase n=1 Tax=Orussus abietinus TaxID=222816 RepID=UPI000626DE60|nr:methylenetetrahydrofolate reductase [Orussus abietinus]